MPMIPFPEKMKAKKRPDRNALESLAESLAGMETWQERCHVKAVNAGITDSEKIAEYIDDHEGDQDDDWLMDRNAALEEMIMKARAASPDTAQEVLWVATILEDFEDRRFTHGPTPDLGALLETVPDGHVIARLRPGEAPYAVGVAIDGELSDLSPRSDEDPSP